MREERAAAADGSSDDDDEEEEGEEEEEGGEEGEGEVERAATKRDAARVAAQQADSRDMAEIWPRSGRDLDEIAHRRAQTARYVAELELGSVSADRLFATPQAEAARQAAVERARAQRRPRRTGRLYGPNERVRSSWSLGREGRGGAGGEAREEGQGGRWRGAGLSMRLP